MNDETNDWESIARRSISMALTEHRIDVHNSVSELSELIHDGEPIPHNDIRSVRSEIFALQRVIEACVVPLVDGAEPWERLPEEMIVEALTDHLGVAEEDINLAVWLRNLRNRDNAPSEEPELTSFRADLRRIIEEARGENVSGEKIAANLLIAIDDIDS